MKTFSYAFLALSIPAIAMDAQHEYSVQNLLDSKPNYQLVGSSECTLASAPDSKKKLTSVKGIENVDTISMQERINLDHNAIRLEGTPFAAIPNAKCNSIRLNSNQIPALIPAFFAGLAHLTQLELADNGITQLPTQWGPLAQLTFLKLSRNKITIIPAGTFAQLKSLITLLLDNNGLKEIHLAEGELPNLKTLDLKGNFKDAHTTLASSNWLAGQLEDDIINIKRRPFNYKHTVNCFGIPEDNLENVVEIIDTDEQP